jgi:hypothetical protein
VTSLMVPDVAEDRLYATRGGAGIQAALCIPAWYKTARGAPIIQDSLLHEEFCYLSDTNATDRVLAGSYIYPDGMDAHTQLLLEEAHFVFRSLLEEEVVNFVTTTDFQSYWRHADKDIQPSESGCHFGHYKAESPDKFLMALHCAKLTLEATTGIPLARWG